MLPLAATPRNIMPNKFATVALGLALATAGTGGHTADAAKPLNAEQLTGKIDAATTVLLKARPRFASELGVDDATAGQHYADKFESYQPRDEAQMRADLAAAAAEIKGAAVEQAGVNVDNQRVAVNLLEYFSGVPGFDVGFIDTWMGHSAFIVNQINGPLIDAPSTMQNSHQVKSLDDAKDYLARLQAFSALTAGVNAKVKHDMEQGWVLPKALMTSTLHFLDNYTRTPAAENTLVTGFATKLEGLDGVDAKHKSEMVKLAEQAVEQHVYPGYRAVAQTLRGSQNKARSADGIWAQPNGDQFYAAMVRSQGDTDMSPDQIHQLGLDEVARITSEMDAILKAEGYNKGTVGERMAGLTSEPRFLYADSDAGRAELLSDLNRYIDEINARIGEQFATAPPYPVEVRRIPQAIEDGAAGGQYTPPTLDGSVPGVYWINLRDMNAVPKFDMKTLTYHEANPGHHWQVALNLAQESLPLLRRAAAYNAYSEGWALYTERVTWEIGMYNKDPFGDLGRLKAEIFRAVRLVVDTGLHYKKWTRDQAIDYMMANAGMNRPEATTEIERYMAWPGQALGYKLGMQKFLALRDEARKALGDKFDPRAFHDVVLLSGAMPMVVVEQKVRDWITASSS
jgi:uncharacterized protein (DUF885 family)